MSLHIQQGHFRVTFVPQIQVYSQLRLHLALLGAGLNTQVTRGENAQRRLHHEFVVLQQYVQDKVSAQNAKFEWQGSLKTPPEIAQRAGQLAWAAWVVDDVQHRVVQSTGGWIKP